MSKIKFNNGTAIGISAFNRYIRYEDNKAVNSLSIRLENVADEELIEPLLADHSITGYTLMDDEGEIIYNKTGLDGHVTSVNETMQSTGELLVEVYATF